MLDKSIPSFRDMLLATSDYKFSRHCSGPVIASNQRYIHASKSIPLRERPIGQYQN